MRHLLDEDLRYLNVDLASPCDPESKQKHKDL